MTTFNKSLVMTKIFRFFILIILIKVLVSCHYSNNTFVIPYNYKGDVVLTFGIMNAPNRKTYNVPISGKVETSAKYESGFLNNKFYIMDSIGGQKELFVINRNDDIDCDKVGILYERIHLSGNIDNENSKYSYIFRVGSKRDIGWCE